MVFAKFLAIILLSILTSGAAESTSTLHDQSTTTTERDTEPTTTELVKETTTESSHSVRTSSQEPKTVQTTEITPTPTSNCNFTDYIDPITGRSRCLRSKKNCFKEGYVEFMKETCPVTCGYCSAPETDSQMTTRNGRNCTDHVDEITGESICPNSKSLCFRQRYVEFMKMACPVTCGYCDAKKTKEKSIEPVCHDYFNSKGVSLCPQYKPYCNHPRTSMFIRKLCPVTCGICVPGDRATTSIPTATPKMAAAF